MQRPLPAGGSLIVLVSVITSTLSVSALPGRIQLPWTVGGPYYGPEFVPPSLVLAAFPLFITGIALTCLPIRTCFTRPERVETIQPLYDRGVLFLLGSVSIVQFVVIVLDVGPV
ncbi:hypothetical protein [Natronorarus salvus]|uniref:hypothetical protein n=1 Tax=Natronorarus salvus TaxID=3117733 RepID=UPI002F25F1DE